MFLNWILGSLAALSCALTLWQWLAARRFPLHRRTANGTFSPAVTLLKPLKGRDAGSEECLRSWLTQDYSAPIQILFGVAAADDSVCELVEKLIAEHPCANAKLVHCGESLGPNAKVSTLIQLERLAQNEFLIISDADVRVPKDFLANMVQPLENSEVGLVNCFYCLPNPSTLAMQWEAIAINADFWSQVLQARTLKPLDFALGAVMATRKSGLKEIGGFESLADVLADDYQLGNKIARSGKRIVLSPVVVECLEPLMNWKRVWAHQLRWARTIRVCQHVPFFFSILSNATLWPLLFTSALLAEHHRIWFVPISIFLPLRIQAALKMQEWLTRNSRHYAWFWLVPIKDLLNAAIWLLAFAGNTIEWRGEKFRVHGGGKLLPLEK
ncbi:MAG: glycosyltransferase [Verrucomicrobiota bacterium]